MKKKPASKSAFFNPRVLITVALCATGALLALLAFALYPGGQAFARQNEAGVPQVAPAFSHAEAPLSIQAASIPDEELPNAAQDVQQLSAPIPPRPVAPDAVFAVNTTNDTQDVTPGDGICADSVGACSLRAAITEANALAGTDTITLPAGTYTTTLVAANEDNNAGGDFDIKSALTINGAGSGTTIIQAAASPNTGTERVIHVTTGAGAVAINNVTIRNGNSTASTAGGGIRVDVATANVTLTNVIISSNRVFLAGNVFGGGAFVSLGSLTLSNCIVFNNSATATTTAFNGFAGGIYNQQGTLNVNNSTITGNSASSFHGGIRALSSTAAATTTNITNSTISNNAALGTNTTTGGGAGEGGGIVNIAAATFPATMTVTGSTMSGNNAYVSGAPGAGTAGGGAENFSVSTGTAVLNLTNSTVSGNSAQFGGGIYTDGSVATVNLNYTTVASNMAVPAGTGGGIQQDTTAGGVTNLKASIVANNTATTGPDISGTITSQDYNLVENTAGGVFTAMPNDTTGVDPQLGALQGNGGPTLTHMPSATSPVLNTIPSGAAGCGTTVTNDQRGFAFTRPAGGACDKGSVERQASDTGTPTPTASPSGTPSPTPSATATATATIPPASPTPSPGICGTILFDQTDNPGTNATSSQNFEAANDNFDNQGADDFVVPPGFPWTVQRVNVNGVYFNGPGPAASFNVTFYADSGTFPGAVVPGGAYTNLAYTQTGSVFSIGLPSNLVLSPGTYWVSVQANMDFTPGGQWGWTDRTVTSNSAAVWQNPGGGFGTSCATYGRRGATCAIDPAAPDQIFQVVGCLGGSPSPTPSATVTPDTETISGNIVYCSNPASPPVANVTMTLTGTASGSTLTDAGGNYSFTGLPPGGTYTVTATKPARAPGSPNINTIDVIAAQRHFLNLGTPLTGCRLAAADVNGDLSVNTVDVIAIQRFFLGLSTGIANTGRYKFNPASSNVCGTILYDQTSNAGTNSTSSQNFEAANDAFDNMGADDFVVPAGSAWTVQQVNVNGVYFNGPGPAASFNVTFYSNSGTLPGAAVATFNGLPYTNTASIFTISLPTDLVLSPGTYWVSVQANMNFTPGGQWGWTDRTVTSNSPAAWQNPGGGFATPCMTWGARGATCGIDAAAPDQIFQIVGCQMGAPGPRQPDSIIIRVRDFNTMVFGDTAATFVEP